MHSKPGPWQKLYDQLASVRITLVLLFAIAGSSLLGTLLPQGMSAEELVTRFGRTRAFWIDLFGLQDLYHAGWFLVLLAFLAANLIVCTLRRLPKTIKLLGRAERVVDPHKLAKFSFHHRLESKLPWEDLVARLDRTLASEFAPVERIADVEGYAGMAEKGRWSPYFVYLIHVSVLVILLGAMVGSILGFKGQVNIDVGSVANEALSSRGHETIALPFAIRCDHFEATFYDSGAPKEFRSDLTLVKNGQEVLKQALRVNDPLTYDGVTLYQASYGSTLQRAEVELTQQPSGKSLRLVLPFRESVAVPDTPYHLQLVNYRDNFHNFGPALAIAVFQEGELPAGSWVLANVPNFHGNRLLDYQVKVVSMEKTAYTGLQVKKDPGTWVVLTGFVLLLVTLGLTFYSSHRRVWIWAEPRNPRHVLHIAARTNKHSLAFEREFQALLQRLREELRTGKGSTSS